MEYLVLNAAAAAIAAYEAGKNQVNNYSLQDIAAMQQRVVLNKTQAIPSLGGQNGSQELRQGKYSDSANPVQAPWEAMPDGGFPFNNGLAINTPAIGAGFTDVINFVVPNGFDGVIRNIVNSYNGGGFQNGSGQLVWRILRNGQAVRNYDNIVVTLGTDSSTGITKIRISSNDQIQYQVKNVSLGGAATQIFCYTGGWFYPVKIGA